MLDKRVYMWYNNHSESLGFKHIYVYLTLKALHLAVRRDVHVKPAFQSGLIFLTKVWCFILQSNKAKQIILIICSSLVSFSLLFLNISGTSLKNIYESTSSLDSDSNVNYSKPISNNSPTNTTTNPDNLWVQSVNTVSQDSDASFTITSKVIPTNAISDNNITKSSVNTTKLQQKDVQKSESRVNTQNTTMSAVKTTRRVASGEKVNAQNERLLPSDSNILHIKKRLLLLINTERRSRGLDVLQLDSALGSASNTRSVDIQSSFSHTRPNGKLWSTILPKGKSANNTKEILGLTTTANLNTKTETKQSVTIPIFKGNTSELDLAAKNLYYYFLNSGSEANNLFNAKYKICGIGVSAKYIYEYSNLLTFYCVIHLSS